MNVFSGTRRPQSPSYEQDGRVIEGVPPPSYALAGILKANPRSVLDFGGALGSTYLRWEPFVRGIAWRVVEQPGFVAKGREQFAGHPDLSFSESPGAADAVLASSVIHYLEHPMETLQVLAMHAQRVLVLDRTPMLESGNAVAVSQHNPWTRGGGSYPMWLLPKDDVHAALQHHGLSLLWEWPGDDPVVKVRGVKARHFGSVWVKAG
jgi:putative methyltransferase (TIGR04325 family)